MGRTHFCSFSISHKPTQLFQDIRCLEPCLHFSFNTTIQPTLPANKQTGSDAADSGAACFLPRYPAPSLLPAQMFVQQRVWGIRSLSSKLGHFTEQLHEHSRLLRRKEQHGSEKTQLWIKEGLLQLSAAAERIQATASATILECRRYLSERHSKWLQRTWSG